MSKQDIFLPNPSEKLISLRVKLAALTIYIIAVLCMWPAYFSHDNDWVLYMAQQVLEGKTAYVDFFEVNPPLIIWLNLPPAILASVTGLSLASALKVYVFCLIAAVLWVSQKLIERIKPWAPRTLFLTITFVLTIVPGSDFAQREHFMLIFLIPYIFLITARAQRTDIRQSWIYMIAIAAAVAICIKPYFILIPAVCETYLLLRLRLQTFRRAEPYVMVVIGLLYLAAIFIGTPNYGSIIVKHAVVVYQAGVGTDWQTMFTKLMPLMMALLFGCVAKIYLKEKFKKVTPLYIIIALIACANLGVFLIQFKGWPNHIYPLHGMMIILITATLNLLYKNYRRRPQLIVLTLGVMFLMPLYGMGVQNILEMDTSSSSTLYLNKRIKAFEGTKLAEGKKVESAIVISADLSVAFPLINETQLDWGSRWPSMWMTPGIQRLKVLNPEDPKVLAAEVFSHETVGQDLASRKPDIVFVHISNEKLFFDAPYDYIADYNRNDVFKAAWKAYEWVDSDKDFALYRRR